MVQIDHLRHRIERAPKAQAVKNVARRHGSSAESRVWRLRGFSLGLEEVRSEPAAVMHCGQAPTALVLGHGRVRCRLRKPKGRWEAMGGCVVRATHGQNARPQPARGAEDGARQPGRRHHRRTRRGQDDAGEL